jgi:uncharacterized membrane protein YhaH (DUF805 family)/cold shock CspA family protein
MRGTVYHYDQDQDFGYINGADGKRYIFAREDLSRHVALVRGTPVEFRPDDGTAHDVVAAASPAGGTAASGAGQLRQPGRFEDRPAASSIGLWAYFWSAVTKDYHNFSDRARRKEFWAFWLFWAIMFVALFGFGMLLNLAINGFGHDAGRTEIGFIPGLFFVLLTILPSIALTVRRLHDIGLSGWLVLLCYVPAFGGLATLVLA